MTALYILASFGTVWSLIFTWFLVKVIVEKTKRK